MKVSFNVRSAQDIISIFFSEKYWEKKIKIYTLPMMHFGRGHLPFLLYNVILSVKLYNNHVKRYQKLLKYSSTNKITLQALKNRHDFLMLSRQEFVQFFPLSSNQYKLATDSSYCVWMYYGLLFV